MSQRIATDSSLMIRSNGERRFHRAYIAANGNPKPLFALVAGKPELRPDGIYYLRYRERDGTRRYEYIGKDPQLARLMQVQRQHLIVGEEMGLPTVEGAKVPRPVKIVPVEIPSVVPLIHPRLPGRHNQQVRSGGRCTPQQKIRWPVPFSFGHLPRDFERTYMDEIGDDQVIAFIPKRRRKAIRSVQ